MRVVIMIALMAIALMAAKCHDGCEKDTTKCENGSVYVCNSNTDWELSVDCGDIDPPELGWRCCLDPEDGVHSCLPESVECEEPVTDTGTGGE